MRREASADGATSSSSQTKRTATSTTLWMDSPGRCARILGDKTLRAIARALVKTVRNNVTIDWTMRETVRAQLRVLVKRTLRKYGYPPDREERATRTVLKQAELFGDQ